MIIELNFKKHAIRKYEWISLVKCDNCLVEREVQRSHILNGKGIKYCKYCNIKVNKPQKKHTLKDYDNLGKKQNLQILENEEIKNNYIRCKWKCLLCNSIFNRSWKDLTSQSYKCSDHIRLEKCNWILHPKIENKEEKFKRKKCVSIIYSLINRTLKYKNDKSYYDLLGYTFDELRTHIENLWEPWMNWSNYGKCFLDKKTWQIDHIKPIYEFLKDGITDPKIINSLNNLRPLESRLNVSKNSTMIF